MHAETHLIDRGRACAVSPAASSDAFRKRREPGVGVVAVVRSLLTQPQPGIGTRAA
jgi:hypothetical protein